MPLECCYTQCSCPALPLLPAATVCCTNVHCFCPTSALTPLRCQGSELLLHPVQLPYTATAASSGCALHWPAAKLLLTLFVTSATTSPTPMNSASRSSESFTVTVPDEKNTERQQDAGDAL